MSLNKNRLTSVRRVASASAAALAFVSLATGTARAAPIAIGTPFMNLENRAVNSIGITPGQFVRFGANSVVPNGDAGTTGVAIQDGTGLRRNIPFGPFPLAPNWFARYLPDDPSLRGNWTLQFTNGSDVATRSVGVAAAAEQAKFVESITISGTSANPTFTWTPSPGTTVNAYRVNFYEKTGVGTNSGNIASINLLPTQTSHTVTAADFTLANYQFTEGKPYSIEISVIQTKDGTTNADNSNLLAIARAYADFTPQPGNSPVVNLPVVLDNGDFKFNIAVVPGQVYYIDPDVAVGYDYVIGAGDPNFASVVLPAGIGDGLFDIFGVDASGTDSLLAADWAAGQTFTFGAGGLAHFRVTGIETDAMLDPGSATAFVTGLTFTGAGKFTGTQTPITVFVNNNVPEPSAMVLAGIALVSLSLTRRRSSLLPRQDCQNCR